LYALFTKAYVSQPKDNEVLKNNQNLFSFNLEKFIFNNVVWIISFIQHLTFWVIDFARKNISSDENWQSIRFLSTFSYVIHAFDTLKVEHLLDREYAKNWSTTYQLYAILAGDHCKNHIFKNKNKSWKKSGSMNWK